MPINDAFDPSILILAGLALFIIWKLRSVLGIRTDREKPAADRLRTLVARSPEAPQLSGTPLPGFASSSEPSPERWKGLAEPDGKGWAGLDAVAAADRSFSGPAFIEGARKAYDIIITAFANGDRDVLHTLLAKDVFDSFVREIERREKRGEKAETALVAIDSAKVEDAKVTADTAQITVRFEAKLVSVRRDRSGQIIEGNPTEPVEIVDLWTFARRAAARDPNWKLIATESGQ